MVNKLTKTWKLQVNQEQPIFTYHCGIPCDFVCFP